MFVVRRGGWGNDRGRVTLGRGKTATKKLAEDAIKLIKNVASKKKKSFSFSFFEYEKKRLLITMATTTSLYSAFLPHIQN